MLIHSDGYLVTKAIRGLHLDLTVITRLQRQDANRNRLIAGYEVSLSKTPDSKGIRVAMGEFSGSLEQQTIRFEEVQSGCYLTFVATKGFGNEPLASLAEIDFLMP